MKKFLTLTFVAALIVGLAAATYAVDFGADGFVRVRTALYRNADGAADPDVLGADPGEDNWDDTSAWVDTRFRLRFSAKHEDVATGVIYFEGDSSRWGEAPDGRNTAGAWNADRNAVELKQFYIDFKVPGLSDFAPTTLRAGIQGFSLRTHFLLFADGAGVELNTTTGPLKWSWYWYKPEEGATNQADDADFYGGRLWLPGLLPVTPGVYFLYLHAGDYPLRENTPGGIGEPSYDTANAWWLGAYLDGKIGPLAIQADAAYFNGKITLGSPESLAIADVLAPDPKASGWGVFTDVSVADIVPNFTFGGAFAYGTGDDLVDAEDLFGNDDEFSGFRVPPGSEEPYIGNWSIVYYASAINDGVRISNLASGTEADLGKLGGTWFAKLYASYKFPAWLKTTVYGMYIGDTTKEGNTIGNARDVMPAIAGFSSGLEDDSDIGIEFGAYCDISIYKNLTYSIGGGYLVAGDALDGYTGVDIPAFPFSIPINDSPADPWAIVSQLIFKF